MISVGFELRVGVAILRVPEGLDYLAILGEGDSQPYGGNSQGPSIAETPPATPNLERHGEVNEFPLPDKTNVTETKLQKKSKKTKKIMT